MDAAVVKLYSLSDSVGATAEDNDFFTITSECLVFLLVGRITIRSVRFKFSTTGIYQFIYRDNPVLQA